MSANSMDVGRPSVYYNRVEPSVVGGLSRFVLVIVAGVLSVVMLVGVVSVFAMMLLMVSKFVEVKC